MHVQAKDDLGIVAESAQAFQPARDIILDRGPEPFRRVVRGVPEHLDDQGRGQNVGRGGRNLVVGQPTGRCTATTSRPGQVVTAATMAGRNKPVGPCFKPG